MLAYVSTVDWVGLLLAIATIAMCIYAAVDAARETRRIKARHAADMELWRRWCAERGLPMSPERQR